MQRHRTQEHNAQFGRLFLRTAMTEDIRSLAAMRTDKGAHILDDPQNGHIHLFEHLQALTRINQRQILRGRNNHGPRQRHLLRQRQLRIPRARRHVQNQHVQLAPFHFAHHLHQGGNHHRAAPDHRRFLVHQEPHRHHLQTILVNRHNPFVHDIGPLGDPHQTRDRRAVDIRIQQTNLQPQRPQAQRKIDRGGRFANPALARRHRQNRLHPGDRPRHWPHIRPDWTIRLAA